MLEKLVGQKEDFINTLKKDLCLIVDTVNFTEDKTYK